MNVRALLAVAYHSASYSISPSTRSPHRIGPSGGRASGPRLEWEGSDQWAVTAVDISCAEVILLYRFVISGGVP